MLQQQFVKFNPEQLNQSYNLTQLIQSNDLYEDYKCKRLNNDYDYFARKIKGASIDQFLFAKLRRIKLYNILPVLDLYHEEGTLITSDFSQHAICNIKIDDSNKPYLAACLSITLQELIFRGIPFNVDGSNIFVIDNHLCLRQIDFNFHQKVSEEESFKSFCQVVEQYFGDVVTLNSFQECTDYYMEQSQVFLGPSENMPYVEFLDKIFQFTNAQPIVDNSANSYVYSFDTPDFMKTTIPNLTPQTVLKSTKLDNGDEEYLITSAQRELEIMETFKKYEPFVSCFAYYRIQNQLYLFMEKFPQDLQKAFETSYIYDRNVKDLCAQLAVAIKHLHKHEIIHRDLKPNNIFLSHEELDRAQALIADFDHSRSTIGTNELTGLSSTRNYEPPESGKIDYDYSSDIWQIGMIFYQIANSGVYPIQLETLAFTQQDYETKFTYEQIKKTLTDKDVDEDFIKVIAACLSYENKLRPTADLLVQQLIECFGDLEIADEETLQSTHQLSMVESYGQLVKRARPFRPFRSAK